MQIKKVLPEILALAALVLGTANIHAVTPGFLGLEGGQFNTPIVMDNKDGSQYSGKAIGQLLEHRFIVPNEPMRYDIVPVLDNAPEGYYVAVGTERGLLAASACKKCTGVVLIDYNELTVVYNIFNILLIRVAEDIKEYYQVRRLIGANLFSEDNFIKLMELSGEAVSKEIVYFIKERWYSWVYQLSQVNNSQFGQPFYNQKHPYQRAFYPFNYLYFEEPFERLQNWAKENKLLALHYDVTKLNDAKGLKAIMMKHNSKISVFDISNLQFSVVRNPDYQSIFSSLLELGDSFTDDSLLLMTQWNMNAKTRGDRDTMAVEAKMRRPVQYVALPWGLLQAERNNLRAFSAWLDVKMQASQMKEIPISYLIKSKKSGWFYECDFANAVVETAPQNICRVVIKDPEKYFTKDQR